MHRLESLESRALFSAAPLPLASEPAQAGHVAVTNVGESPKNNSDFNGDGHNDLFLRDLDIGFNGVQFLHGGAPGLTGNVRGWNDTEWRAVGVADLTGDGRADILFRNIETGQNRIWKMRGASRIDEINLPRVNLNWRFGGTGDFTGDGRIDLMWRNTRTGQNVVWEMNNSTFIRGHTLRGLPNRQWLAAGVGDFTGDGKPDILFRHQATGQNVVWRMNGKHFVRGTAIPSRTDLDWQVAEVKDFDGDGDADVIFRNLKTGDTELWRMSRLQRAERDDLPRFPTNWQAPGTNVGPFGGADPTRLSTRSEGRFSSSWQSGGADGPDRDEPDALGGVSIVINL